MGPNKIIQGTTSSGSHKPVLVDVNGALVVNLGPDGTQINVGTVIAEATYNSSLPILTNGAAGSLQADANGRLLSAVVDAYASPVVASWSSSTTTYSSSTASGQWTAGNNVGLFAVNTAGMDTVIVTLVTGGSHSGGVVIFEVFDGAAWIPVKSASVTDYTTTSVSTLGANFNVGYQVPVAGFPQFRCRLSSAPSSGTLTLTIVVSSAPDTSVCTVGIDPSTTLPYITAPSAPIAGQQSVTTSAAALASKTVTTGVVLTNTGTTTVYVGPSGVTTSNGYALTAGSSIGLVVANTSSIYVIGAVAGTICFLGS